MAVLEQENHQKQMLTLSAHILPAASQTRTISREKPQSEITLEKDEIMHIGYA